MQNNLLRPHPQDNRHVNNRYSMVGTHFCKPVICYLTGMLHFYTYTIILIFLLVKHKWLMFDWPKTLHTQVQLYVLLSRTMPIIRYENPVSKSHTSYIYRILSEEQLPAMATEAYYYITPKRIKESVKNLAVIGLKAKNRHQIHHWILCRFSYFSAYPYFDYKPSH